MSRRHSHSSHSHYDHVGAFYHPGLGETFIPTTATFADVRAGTAIIQRPAKGDAVAQIQTLLNALGFRDSRGRALIIDKLFGPNTQFALRAAQAAIRAKVPTTTMIDGALDKATLAALEAMQAGQPLPGEAAPVAPTTPPAVLRTPETPWWKSPLVLGGGVVAALAIVALAMSGEKKKPA
jgi:hypothetical protein